MVTVIRKLISILPGCLDGDDSARSVFFGGAGCVCVKEAKREELNES